MNTIMLLFFTIVKFLMIMIPILVSVAYLTLLESKTMGYIQMSKGPNVVGIYGLLQPLADGVKLFSKEMVIPNHVSISLYLFAPILALTLGLGMWSVLPLHTDVSLSNPSLGMLVIFALSSISVYAMLMSGWSSNSKYAFLGALSAAAQMMSYEVSIGLIIMSSLLCVGSFNLMTFMETQKQGISLLIPLLPVALMFFISCLAETNSAPFDLTEGESELVSGFNVEYSSMSFALFFLAEYSHIIFMSFLFVVLFWGSSFTFLDFNLTNVLKSMFIVFMFIWVSASFPSLSYDQLMLLLWKSYLPLSLGMIIVTNSLLLILNALPPKLCF